MSDLPTTDEAASAADKTVVEIVGDLTPIVEKLAIADQPWLAWPVFCQLWEGCFSWLTGYLGKAAGLSVGFIVVDVQKYQALKASAQALAALQAAKKTGDPHAIQQASDAADAAIAPILHFVGTVSPPRG